MAVMDMVMGVITYPCCNVVVGLGVACLGAALYLINRYAAGGVCRSKALLNGKTVVITGGNTGIGLETAVDLAKRNARVILACRSVERGEKAAVEVRKRSKSDNVVFVQLDLASLDSVRRFADTVLQREPRIDVLVNNAGIMALPQRKETKEGFEMQFGVNHLGHFLLTNLLLDRIKEAPAGRIVNVSSVGHRRGKMDFDDLNSVRSYSAFGAYGRSKLANVLFTRSLAKRLALEGTNTTANSLHPGGVRTELGRNLSIYLVFLLGDQLEELFRRVATQYQYLAVKYRDGRKEHIPGPQEMFLNRLVVEDIQVKNAIALDANHVLIVYKQKEQEITRRVVRGPTLFIPDAQEWIHEFDWHGSDKLNLGRWIPHGHKFTQLSHVPSQIYLNVRDVRTNDDTLLLVKLMIFYELADIVTMLNNTYDPIADFINAVSSDIIGIASQMNYEEFLQQTHQLNQLASYPQLTSRADRIGFKIKKVFYRGYQASSALQATHDEAVEKRTKLKLHREEEEQQQHLQEFKLKREKKRTKLKQEMERKIQEHTQELERLKQDTVIVKEKLIHEASLKKSVAEVEAKLEVEKAQHLQRKHFLSHLESLGVDMTKYLVGIQPEFVPEKEIVVGPAFNTATTPLTVPV